MNMVHDMDKEVYKVCSCPRIKSYMHCTHIRKGMWVVGSEAISYFLREHPRTNQLLFDLFFNASSLFRCYQYCSFIFHLFCLVLAGKFVLKYSRGDIAMLWSLNIVDCRDHFSKKVKLSLFYARLNSRKN